MTEWVIDDEDVDRSMIHAVPEGLRDRDCNWFTDHATRFVDQRASPYAIDSFLDEYATHLTNL
jgi:hypothetical protein